MQYVFADWVPVPEAPAEDGIIPVRAGIPDSLSPLSLTSVARMKWGIFQVEGCPDSVQAAGLEAVPAALALLLRSGQAYSPAIALARDDMKRDYRDSEDPDRATFVRDYADALSRHLQGQASAGYLLVRSVQDELGYIQTGGYYWVLEYHSHAGEVSWVSDDYFVYRSSVQHFDLSDAQKRHLSKLSD